MRIISKIWTPSKEHACLRGMDITRLLAPADGRSLGGPWGCSRKETAEAPGFVELSSKSARGDQKKGHINKIMSGSRGFQKKMK